MCTRKWVCFSFDMYLDCTNLDRMHIQKRYGLANASTHILSIYMFCNFYNFESKLHRDDPDLAFC